MKILAIDPGSASGVAMLTGKNFTCGEIMGGHIPLMDFVWHKLHDLDAIVIERFNINSATHTKTRNYDALYAIGTTLWMGEYAHIPVTLQNPSVGKGKDFATHDKLEKLGWYMPSKGGHQVDASCHLLQYVVQLPQYAWIVEELLA